MGWSRRSMIKNGSTAKWIPKCTGIDEDETAAQREQYLDAVCCWCGSWHGMITAVPEIGLICLKCQHFGPPFIEQLIGLRLSARLLQRTDGLAKLALAAYDTTLRIAKFAYEVKRRSELQNPKYGYIDKSARHCEFCDSSWVCWNCKHCLRTYYINSC